MYLTTFQRITLPPTDLVNIWEDYDYIAADWDRGGAVSSEQVQSWRQISGHVIEHAVQCPVLLHIAAASLWFKYPSLTCIRHLLNLSWDEVRASLCRLRSIIPEELRLGDVLALLIRDWMTQHKATWRSDICDQLGWGIIQVRKLMEIGHLPEPVW
jgi:hypothetical protein